MTSTSSATQALDATQCTAPYCTSLQDRYDWKNQCWMKQCSKHTKKPEQVELAELGAFYAKLTRDNSVAYHKSNMNTSDPFRPRQSIDISMDVADFTSPPTQSRSRIERQAIVKEASDDIAAEVRAITAWKLNCKDIQWHVSGPVVRFRCSQDTSNNRERGGKPLADTNKASSRTLSREQRFDCRGQLCLSFDIDRRRLSITFQHHYQHNGYLGKGTTRGQKRPAPITTLEDEQTRRNRVIAEFAALAKRYDELERSLREGNDDLRTIERIVKMRKDQIAEIEAARDSRNNVINSSG